MIVKDFQFLESIVQIHLTPGTNVVLAIKQSKFVASTENRYHKMCGVQYLIKVILRDFCRFIKNYQALSIQSADYVIFDNMPVVSDNRPVESDNMPVESDNMPVESDNMPVDSDNMPVHCSS